MEENKTGVWIRCMNNKEIRYNHDCHSSFDVGDIVEVENDDIYVKFKIEVVELTGVSNVLATYTIKPQLMIDRTTPFYSVTKFHDAEPIEMDVYANNEALIIVPFWYEKEQYRNQSIRSTEAVITITRKESLKTINEDLEIKTGTISADEIKIGTLAPPPLSERRGSFLPYYQQKPITATSEAAKNEVGELSTTGKSWTKAMTIGDVIGRIRNHSIGTLLVNISEGMDLDNAVKAYENVVAPANYKRPKAIFTKKMLEDAKKTVTDLGYMDSLQRRFARLDDITVNTILFCNRDAAPRIQGGLDIFDEMSKEVAVNPKKFSKVEEISAEKFVSDVLPTAKELEVLFENRHKKNMVSLIAPVNKNAKNMMKWNNPFSWAYSGNMTDSEMKERVKNAGGAVDGVLRFSIQWNAGKDWNRDDFDAHCKTPCQHIFFSHMVDSKTQGRLDVDVINPVKGKPAVENITWADKSKMVDGNYEFFVHNYNHHNGTSGFTAEIEFDGQIYEFEYDQPLRQGQNVPVATVTLKDGVFTIKEKLPSTTSSREIWGVNTNQFVPVTVMCYSPNYWDEQTGIGHKHYLFMLNGCVNEDTPNGFFNEFLKQELVQHKRVFEALGSKMHVADDPNQLSGIGFSSTKRDDVIVKVKGATERALKIKF